MKYQIFLFLVLIPSILFSQQDTTNSKTYRVTYSALDNKKESKEYKRLIKINPILFLGGDLPIYFEQKLTDVFTAEAGIGITYYDYISNQFMLVQEDRDYSSFNISPDFGYSFRANLKYYPSYILDEWYFGLGYQYKKFFYSLENTDIPDIYNEEVTINDVRLMVGYIYYFTNQVFVDVYGTMGFRNKNFFNYMESSTYKLPVISAGVKIGFAI